MRENQNLSEKLLLLRDSAIGRDLVIDRLDTLSWLAASS